MGGQKKKTERRRGRGVERARERSRVPLVERLNFRKGVNVKILVNIGGTKYYFLEDGG